MIPIKITLSGFMSYREQQTLDFADDSLWVLVGKNATGKSSIFDAIVFALFGKARVDGINHADLINHQCDQAVIIFEFAVGHDLYRVKRTIDQRKQGTRQAWILLPKTDGSLFPDPVPGTHRESEFKRWVEDGLGLNFEVFTTSVLLRQGKADRFLEASTEERYDVLSKLIDLTKYAALAEKAREYKRHWEAQADVHRDNLSRIPPVNEADLTSGGIAVERERESQKSALGQEERLHALYGQAVQWERLYGDLEGTAGQISQRQALLDRAEEIDRGYRRWSELRSVLPGLAAARGLIAAIDSVEKEIKRIHEESKAQAEQLDQARANVTGLEGAWSQKDGEAQWVQEQYNGLIARLDELSPIITLVTQVEQLRQEVAKRLSDLSAYPQNLNELLAEHTAERDALLEAQRAYSGLARLLTERAGLLAAETRRRGIDERFTQNQSLLPGRHQAKEDALAEVKQAEDRERIKQTELTRTESLHSAAEKRMDDFNSVAGEPECRYCGQPLTPEHVDKEHHLLEKEIADLIHQVAEAKQGHTEALYLLSEANVALRSADIDLGRLETSIRDDERDLNTIEGDLNTQLNALKQTYHALPEAFQLRVSAFHPDDLPGWERITFPQPADLEALQAEIRRIPNVRSEVDRLTRLVNDCNNIKTLYRSVSDSLNTRETDLPADWELAREEHLALSASKGDLLQQLNAAQRTAQAAQKSLDEARKKLTHLREQQVGRDAAIDANQKALERSQKNLADQIRQLPEAWRADTADLTQDRFEALTEEKGSLDGFEQQHQDLESARQSLTDLQARAARLEAEMEQLPLEARQPAAQVKHALNAARDESDAAGTRLRQAETQQAKLIEQLEQYQRTEASQRAAERNAHLYGILHDQFGERGIQKAIMNKTEQAIVRLSNQMLDNLSGGRSQLRLREAGGNRKAMDLEVWDSVTGAGRPLLVGLASGSQRFRIAISLALGIGQYIGRESHRIESVIIDEGFGSLDREGRESVIQELYNLRQHLKRIILVSHQEEFSRGFQNGYEIFLEDGESQVKPIG